MVLDLTLNAIQIPGLTTFTKIFGTKKADGKGLTTAEVNANMLAPWNRQRPYTVAEISSTGVVEADACISIATGCSAITLGDGSFTGVRVLLINTTPSAVQLITGQESGYILPYQTLEVMWFGDCWYVCDGHMVGEILNVTFPLTKIPFGYMSLHSGLRPSRTAYKRLANTILYPLANVPFTCTTAAPAVFTVAAGHGFSGGERLRLFTSGALAGATLSQDYFVEYISTTTFYLNTLEGGTARLAITAQSGTHYYQCSAYGVGDGSTTMDLPDPRQSAFVGAGTGTTHNIASVDSYLRGQFKDDRFQGWKLQITKSDPGWGGSLWGNGDASTRVANVIYTQAIVADTANGFGTPRVGTTTRTKQLGTNYLIKY
jgi:hypothetical protein